MESWHKLLAILVVCITLFHVSRGCGNEAVEAQKEKTKQLQIQKDMMNARLMYQPDYNPASVLR